jgi:hypothetical protein
VWELVLDHPSSWPWRLCSHLISARTTRHRTTPLLECLEPAWDALVADATRFGPGTRTLALVLLPVVLFLGLVTYMRLVQIGSEDFCWCWR